MAVFGGWNPQLPRLPHALARHQEALPLASFNKKPVPIIETEIITLRSMCSKYWLEKVQFILKSDLPKYHVFALSRFLAQLPRELRSSMIHNVLRSGGLHLSHGSRELPAVNRALVLLTSDLVVREPVFIRITKNKDPNDLPPPDIELVTRSGEGIQKIVMFLPDFMDEKNIRILKDICRTCRMLKEITIHEATDEIVTLITRHCSVLNFIDVSGSEMVTDEGLSRIVTNVKWGPNDVKLRYLDVDRTSVTEEGILNVLTRLPEITSYGTKDIMNSLQIYEELSQDGTTSIEEMNLKCVTTSRIQTIRKLCPRLWKISANFQENPASGSTLNELRLLPNITHLNLSVKEPFLLSPQNLNDYAWSIGSKLAVLKLSGDVYWEADLGLLASHCPFLETLSLPAATVPTPESLKALSVESPLMSKLEVLEIDCMVGVGPKAWAKDYNLARRGLVVFLSRCKRLRRVLCRPTVLVDEDIRQILSVNRMNNLEVAELYNCVLGVQTAKLLIDSCTCLHLLKGLRTWRGITLMDLVSLRKHSRGHRRHSELKVLP